MRAQPTEGPHYKRVLLKLSGEAFEGDRDFGIDPTTIRNIASQIHDVAQERVELAVVVGGGNIFRGVAVAADNGIERATADYMGMLATVMNALALQEGLEKLGTPTRVQSALQITELCEPYIRRRANRHLEKKRVVIFAAGTGNPFFTTDTAASLRAIEIGADVILKATKVAGVYDKDPESHKDAKMYASITHMDCLRKGLKVMDSTAISLCMDNKMPIRVFSLLEDGNIRKVVHGQQVGTIVSS